MAAKSGSQLSSIKRTLFFLLSYLSSTTSSLTINFTQLHTTSHNFTNTFKQNPPSTNHHQSCLDADVPVLPPAAAVRAALVLPAEYVASSNRCFGVVLLEACTNETRNKFDFVTRRHSLPPRLHCRFPLLVLFNFDAFDCSNVFEYG
jgi:hypothetical protein